MVLTYRLGEERIGAMQSAGRQTPSEWPARSRRLERTRGQALVETAIMLPVILILVLGALDFGRLFFTFVGLHQAARIGANHASVDPGTTSAEIPGIIQSETDVISCDAGSISADLIYTSGGAQVTDAELGNYARVTLGCDFRLLTPLAGVLFGDPVAMTAISQFPVRTGCLNCGGGGGPPPLPDPPPNQCRTVPTMGGMSVAGARLAWLSAGFIGSFDAGGAGDYDTVDPNLIVIDPLDPACPDPLAIFNAQVAVGILSPEGSPPGPVGCNVIRNLIGLRVDDARTAWESDTAFTGTFDPPQPDPDPSAAVTAQTTSQGGSPVASEPGVTCMDPATDIQVTVGAPWANPPPAPCQVPHMIDKTRSEGSTAWYGAKFVAGTFSPTQGQWKIKWQSLVGFSWLPCDSTIVVDNKAP